MSVTIPTQTDKCRGAMIATAIGDALDGPMKYVQKTSLKMPEMATILWPGFGATTNHAITMKKFCLENTVMIRN